MMDDILEKNPDSNFVLHGQKKPLRQKSEEYEYVTNTKKTISTKNLSESLNLSQKHEVPTIEDLQRSVDALKFDIDSLSCSLRENYGKSDIFLTENAKDGGEKKLDPISYKDDDDELTFMMQRDDHEAVSHRAADATATADWYSDPKHLTRPLVGDYPTMQTQNVSKRAVSPVNRTIGRIGAEIAAKDVEGAVTGVDVAASNSTFPVKLTAPHIVGVHSLLQPRFPVKGQNPERAKSPQRRSRSVENVLIQSRSVSAGGRKSRRRRPRRRGDRSPSPRPVWMPVTPKPNASGTPMPKFTVQRGRSRERPATATGGREASAKFQPLVTRSLQVTASAPYKPYEPHRYQRPSVQPTPGSMELSFLQAADQIDTRRSLVEHSPYQQQLAKLRLERLRVEEEYLLQLKRESELERIRGPKPKWYEFKGPQFHYECNKNTALHKNREQWSETLDYRRKLLTASREFTANMRGPVPNPE